MSYCPGQCFRLHINTLHRPLLGIPQSIEDCPSCERADKKLTTVLVYIQIKLGNIPIYHRRLSLNKHHETVLQFLGDQH